MSPPRQAIRGGALLCVVLLFVLFIMTSRSPDPVRQSPSIEKLFSFGRTQQPWVVRQPQPWTTYDGGIEGYTVWSNLYLSGGTLIAACETEEELDRIPKAHNILSHFDGAEILPPGPDVWTATASADLAGDQFGDAVRLPGVTYLFTDPPGLSQKSRLRGGVALEVGADKDRGMEVQRTGLTPGGFIVHHYHFIVDLLVPAARAVASARAAARLPQDTGPARVIFPRCGEEPSWRDEQGLNSWLLRTMFPKVVIEDKSTWDDWARGDVSYVFEQVVIVDRRAAHTAKGNVSRWGRMNGNVPAIDAPPGFWDMCSSAMARSIGDLLRVGRFRLPVVVYIERDSQPLLNPTSNDALVAGLKELTGRAEVHIARVQGMTRRQKVALLSRANIVIGLNAEDLLQIAWMQVGKGNGVVELFEAEGFTFDYALLAHMLGLKHIAIQGNRELTPMMWSQHPSGKRGPQNKGVIDIDANMVLSAVVRLLEGLESAVEE